MTFPYGQPVTLLTRAVTGHDGFGNDIYSNTSTTVLGAFDPGGSVETIQGEDLVVSQPTIYLPAGTQIGSVDAVQVAGQVFEVDGSPNAPLNPFSGWEPGVVVRLRGVTG